MAAVALSVHTDIEEDLDQIDEEVDAIAAVFADDATDSDDAPADDVLIDDAPASPETPPTSADTPLPSWVETYINETRELESRAASIAVKIEWIKEDLKSEKQHYEDAVNELRQLVRRGPDRQQRLPFPDDDQVTPEPITVNTTETDDDSWKPTPIIELDGLAEPIKNKLLDAGISTVGELADFTATGNLLTDVKGIGAAKAEKIEAALEKFWEGRKQ